VGVIFAESPRRVTLADARAVVRSVPSFVTVVGVFVNQEPATVIAACELGCRPQFSGRESPELCAASALGHRYIKAVHIEREAESSTEDLRVQAERFAAADLLFDSRYGQRYGGTGIAFNWDLIASIVPQRRVIVGGGLVPENVGECVTAVRPYAVDVRSGVETNDRKDEAKMRAFVRAVRESDAKA
jgi:phosphoribosylanthranilate isomerase